MGYDTGGRLSTVTLPDDPPGSLQIYTHAYFPDLDPNVFAGNEGNLQSITAPDGGTLSFTYDGSLLLSSTWGGTFPITGSITWTYDTDFRITSSSVNGANTITFGYDNDSLVTSAGAETLQYDSEDPANPGTFLTNGFLRSTTLGVVTDSYQYNSFGEVSNYTAQISAVDQFATGFTRDKLGRITQKTETIQGVTHTFDYTYNTAGYLVEVKRDGIVQDTYTYDLNGNRLNNGAIHDNQDRLISTNTATYTYTDNGDLLTKTKGTDTTQYKYDALGNLLSTTLPSGTLIEYIIDGQYRRIGRKVDGVLENAWLYKDDLNPIAELDGAGNVISRFVYASKVNVPDYVIKGGVTYRIISDHLGSPRLIIDTTTGAITQQIEYDDWGNILVDTNPGFQPFAFAGGLYDQDTKLIRFGARDYDPEIGRWTAKDPIRFDGDDPNLYGYVLNDPVNAVDITGEYWQPVWQRLYILIHRGGRLLVKAYQKLRGAALITGRFVLKLYGHIKQGACKLGKKIGDKIKEARDFVKKGKEIKIGKNLRIAPFGNRTGHPTGRYPHYHRRPNSNPPPGQSIRRHRPWDSHPADKSFWDRF